MLTMLLLAALQPTPPQPQARATVRIHRPAALRFAEIVRDTPQRLRASKVRSGEDAGRAARLVEFE